MVDKEKIKAAIVAQHQRSLPLMDVEAVKAEMMDWLFQLKLPANAQFDKWGDCINEFPSPEHEKSLDSGLRMRLSLKLQTQVNKYMVCIMECLDPAAREVYIVCCYKGWQQREKQLQQSLEQSYIGSFQDVLRSRHSIWVQTFRMGELVSALDCCARAILGEELVTDRVQPEVQGEKISPTMPIAADFPAD